MLILFSFKHHYFLQLSHLNLTEILFALKTLLFQISAIKESRPIGFNIWFD